MNKKTVEMLSAFIFTLGTAMLAFLLAAITGINYIAFYSVAMIVVIIISFMISHIDRELEIVIYYRACMSIFKSAYKIYRRVEK